MELKRFENSSYANVILCAAFKGKIILAGITSQNEK